MDSPTFVKIVKELAKEYDLTYMETKEIVKSQFECVADVMRNGNREDMEFKSIRLPNFGIFRPMPGRVEFYKKLNEKQRNDS